MGTFLSGSHAATAREVGGMALQPDRLGAALVNGIPLVCSTGTRTAGAFHCVECGYGVTVREQLPRCPMCGSETWERARTSLSELSVSG
jgi:predicted RNA-binding Zn-ribbon protein involved in translation (DUF1610 family)